MSARAGRMRPVSADRLQPVDLDEVRRAYTVAAAAYIASFGDASRASASDRAVIGAWADGLDGPVLDAGCGPGHWSGFLHERGLQVEGVDATAAFVDHATRSRPGVRFSLADLRGLELVPGSLGGVLAWFSLIHLEPDDVPGVLDRFVRGLAPSGGLLLGFFAGPALRTFDHRVATAWAWPVARLEELVIDAGFETTETAEEPQPNDRVTAWLRARRRS